MDYKDLFTTHGTKKSECACIVADCQIFGGHCEIKALVIYIYILHFYFRFKNLGDTARKVMAFDKLSIICPNLVEYPIIRNTSFSKDLLYQNVYMVDENGYDNCNATGGLSILICDDPTKYSHATIVFQPSTADINDPKFEQGKVYYFISKCHCSSNK